MNSIIKLQIDVLPSVNSIEGADGHDDDGSVSPLMRDPKANLAQIFNEEQRQHKITVDQRSK